MRYVDGDLELLDKIVARFMDTCPKHLQNIEDAIAKQDAKALEFSAHALKGAISNFFANPAREAAFRLEGLGRDGKLADARQAFEILQTETEKLREALAIFGKEAVS
jgi:HPt (histidine-containing phosphotransfer) domain-containing protein